ncbi:helix-turn-helix transcriptional regulator [Rhizobium sp. P38BS-XIX]|uniref:winged helix-turn-helix transcriptional regulator n=1 Tax=Rhizobium sp. P38BS-XIX TaxID=2726740 RepID=UPI001456D83F|nr:helix-turn-helix domain-containing protein [Rhizobium sp. P38BS-XIX]NLR96089.1 helix-turn-helix transcriptional regulator [Rhizobium sp. P38BS-XIX]
MQRTNFSTVKCPAARSLESVGDWWSILILRDAFQGLSKFDEFQKNLGIAPNILTRRLKHLTEEGLFDRRLYNERPPRYEYVLTTKGRDFFPVLMALFTWGNQHMPAEEVAMRLADVNTGEDRDPLLIDRVTGRAFSPEDTILVPGPAADEAVHERIAQMKAWFLGFDA